MAKGMAALAAVLLTLGWVGDAQAQWSTKWLSVGELHHAYLSGGAEPENLLPNQLWVYPGIRPSASYNHWKGLWISAKNWTDESGQPWEVKTSHIGPRILGIGEFFDVTHRLIARFEPPVVRVDGFETFHRPVTVDAVDPSIAPDRMVHTVTNSSVGVTMDKKAMQWSNEYHDNYHIIEYTFTNTGNTDDDADIELPNQTLQDVYFTFMDRPKINAEAGSWDNSSGGMAWGRDTMTDAVGDGMNDYDVDWRGHFSWMGYIPERSRAYNTIGNPMWYNHQWNSVRDDTLGRLGGANFVGQVVIHADARAHAPGTTVEDDPAQPHTMTTLESDWSDITTGSDHTNLSKMRFERQWIECGSTGNPTHIDTDCDDPRTTPTHAYMVTPSGDFLNQNTDPSLGRAGGWGYMNAYGPYTLQPGEQVRIVVAEGVAGLSYGYREAAWTIGREYKLSGADDDREIAFDANGNGTIEEDERLTKNEWVFTARDSLFQMFERAIANYRGGGAVPQPPMPPRVFEVVSGTDQINLSWEPYSGAEPAAGWEIWRAQNDYNGIVNALRVNPTTGLAIPDTVRAYRCIAGCPGTPALPSSARSYTDTNVERGLSYFYYLQAVGEVNTNGAALTPTGARLKSNRYYAQTYEPAFLRRPPGAQLSNIRIVPNPFNLASTTDVRFGDKQDKLAFYGLPGVATIKIYTELGELVETIEHTDGSGDEFWFMTTSSRQLIVSGVYIAVIENKDPNSDQFGEQVIRKFIIIR